MKINGWATIVFALIVVTITLCYLFGELASELYIGILTLIIGYYAGNTRAVYSKNKGVNQANANDKLLSTD